MGGWVVVQFCSLGAWLRIASGWGGKDAVWFSMHRQGRESLRLAMVMMTMESALVVRRLSVKAGGWEGDTARCDTALLLSQPPRKRPTRKDPWKPTGPGRRNRQKGTTMEPWPGEDSPNFFILYQCNN
ncbi:hypothetical protein LZ32DRAFT_93812 [Colletotrichum eremochloae]|nr:hypothetical protein LZ32DRAFT_93812 [Colletotrichum eremochloae]